MIKIGIQSFSDGRERVHKTLEPVIKDNLNKIIKVLEATGEVTVVTAERIAFSPDVAKEEARKLVAQNVDCTIFNIPVFAFPNYPVIAAANCKGPFLLLTPKFGGLPGLGGILAAGGGMKQVGMKIEKVWGDINDKKILDRIMVWARASYAISQLKGQIFGLIGGRSIGMSTGAASTAQWQREFGVDIDHVDQLEIIRLADKIPDDDPKIQKAFDWLNRTARQVSYLENKLTEKTLKYQIKCYYATKEIIATRKFDFVAVKCHYELSEYYVPQCISAVFFNDPYDWDGKKDTTVYSCEADADGALSMQILKHVSGGMPVIFYDFRHYDEKEKVFVMCNCGAQASWFAGRSDKPEENMKNVALEPVIPKYAGGGAHVQYICKAGTATMARLSREGDTYEMLIVKGEYEEYPLEKLKETCWNWPHGFMKINSTMENMVNLSNSNHFHAVAGDYVEELKKFCELKGIKSTVVE